MIFIIISSALQCLPGRLFPQLHAREVHLISRNHVWYIMAKRIRKAGEVILKIGIPMQLRYIVFTTLTVIICCSTSYAVSDQDIDRLTTYTLPSNCLWY